MSSITIYPDPHPESSSVDGRLYCGGVSGGSTWDNLHHGVDNKGAQDDSASAGSMAHLSTSLADVNKFYVLQRGGFLFDTSVIPDDADIDSASLWLRIQSKYSDLGNDDVHVVAFNPASNTALVANDFNQFSWVSFGSLNIVNDITTSYPDGTYNEWVLNATGLAALDLDGITKLGTILGWDLNDSFGGSWAEYTQCGIIGFYADKAGTDSDPKLVITGTWAMAHYKALADAVAIAEADAKLVGQPKLEAFATSESHNDSLDEYFHPYKSDTMKVMDSIALSINKVKALHIARLSRSKGATLIAKDNNMLKRRPER